MAIFKKEFDDILKNNKELIESELAKLTFNEINDNCDYLDENTWIIWGVPTSNIPKFREVLESLVEKEEDDDEEYIWLCIEYWLDEDSIKYLVQVEGESILVNEFINCKNLNEIVLKSVREEF